MPDGEIHATGRAEPWISVDAADIDENAIGPGMELVQESEPAEPPDHPEELREILDTMVDIYRCVKVAAETDSRGRSRKMVRQYADCEDLRSDAAGHILWVLEVHVLVAQDGNRWRIPGSDN